MADQKTPLLNPKPPPRASEEAWRQAMQPPPSLVTHENFAALIGGVIAVVLFGASLVLVCSGMASANRVEGTLGIIAGALFGISGLLVIGLTILWDIMALLRNR